MKKMLTIMMMLCMGQVVAMEAERLEKKTDVSAKNTAIPREGSEEGSKPKNLNWIQMIRRNLRNRFTKSSLKSDPAVVKNKPVDASQPVVFRKDTDQSTLKDDAEIRALENRESFINRAGKGPDLKPKPTPEQMTKDLNRVNKSIKELETKKAEVIADIDRQLEELRESAKKFTPEDIKKTDELLEKQKQLTMEKELKDLNADLAKLEEDQANLKDTINAAKGPKADPSTAKPSINNSDPISDPINEEITAIDNTIKKILEKQGLGKITTKKQMGIAKTLEELRSKRAILVDGQEEQDMRNFGRKSNDKDIRAKIANHGKKVKLEKEIERIDNLLQEIDDRLKDLPLDDQNHITKEKNELVEERNRLLKELGKTPIQIAAYDNDAQRADRKKVQQKKQKQEIERIENEIKSILPQLDPLRNARGDDKRREELRTLRAERVDLLNKTPEGKKILAAEEADAAKARAEAEKARAKEIEEYSKISPEEAPKKLTGKNLEGYREWYRNMRRMQGGD